MGKSNSKRNAETKRRDPSKQSKKPRNKKRNSSLKLKNQHFINPLTTARPQSRSTHDNGYRSFMEPSGGTKELVCVATDFFDSTVGYTFSQYQFDLTKNSLFEAMNVGSGINLCKVKSAKFYALPAFSLATSTSTVMILFSLPVYTGTKITASSHQTTALTPSSVSTWVKVGEWHANSVLKDSNVLPVTNGDLQILGNVMAVKPDTGEPATIAVQYMVEIEYAQTLPNLAAVYGQVFPATTPVWAGIASTVETPEKLAAIVDLRYLADSI